MLNTYIDMIKKTSVAKDVIATKFSQYKDLLIEYNKHTNLTRITEANEVYVKHFLDSCLLGELIDFNQVTSLCDMGSGAGFPGVPLLIIYPHLKLTIVESQIKRVQFLNALKETLKLDFEVIHERAEVYAKKNQMKFDLVTARALGDLQMILEFGVPMLKTNGYFIAPKGSRYQEELELAKNAIKTLNCEVDKIETFDLPEANGFRANILLQKKSHISGYPREYSKMIKKPL
ncbi:16S rRNA (guanine(527)-N(7))-methyltransferase RsmG [Acholeplasma equirhinis]|uniref:16S rRNA (guanine(527)-N(7))-methyltransferase RsmG n=1 Tax=Acholeplasma equirhinis TaxID=555393 RepID=UPI00197AFDAA|nr:16S rRNA (guanine(527)-N(7))-methyltransferase RsmG [Acholeplasma equirhinis]MBN3491103.1 16S rRNA (guanine(527)-N(7))-methyltransferase RsmG [Acholeplasma equirhinis]